MPFYLRCRASMKAMVSKYANAMEAERASPPPNSADVALVFQVRTQYLEGLADLYLATLPCLEDLYHHLCLAPTILRLCPTRLTS